MIVCIKPYLKTIFYVLLLQTLISVSVVINVCLMLCYPLLMTTPVLWITIGEHLLNTPFLFKQPKNLNISFAKELILDFEKGSAFSRNRLPKDMLIFGKNRFLFTLLFLRIVNNNHFVIYFLWKEEDLVAIKPINNYYSGLCMPS